MIRMKKNILAAIAGVATLSLTACGKASGDVVFWSSFGGKYSNKLDAILADMSEELGITIDHSGKGGYPKILQAVVESIPTTNYPGLAVGYPDHFAQYHGSNILRSLDSYVTQDMLNDYDPNYLPENYLYDTNGQKHLYGVPFNKSTELLGYNGVFVDYCAWKYRTGDQIDESLLTPPETWDEWNLATSQTIDLGKFDKDKKVDGVKVWTLEGQNAELAKIDTTTKAGKYLATFYDLIINQKKIYGVQNEEGTASGFTETAEPGKKLLFNFENKDIMQSRLFTWDATDNAFITLVRQWDAKYTELPSDQYQYHPKQRQGKVLFANAANKDKTLSMLKFFNTMYKKTIFGTPSDVTGSYSSDAFADGRVMFMVCSSGGLGYNTGTWENRFRVRPIPYKDASHKYVISQGANICMTKAGDADTNFKVIKALTTGKYQTRWAIETGYFPASNSAADTPEYQEFLNATKYDDYDKVAYREGARVNENEYRAKGWNRFVDDAFIGSAKVRTQVGYILANVFKNVSDLNNDEGYKTEIKTVLNDPFIKNDDRISVDIAF